MFGFAVPFTRWFTGFYVRLIYYYIPLCWVKPMTLPIPHLFILHTHSPCVLSIADCCDSLCHLLLFAHILHTPFLTLHTQGHYTPAATIIYYSVVTTLVDSAVA